MCDCQEKVVHFNKRTVLIQWIDPVKFNNLNSNSVWTAPSQFPLLTVELRGAPQKKIKTAFVLVWRATVSKRAHFTPVKLLSQHKENFWLPLSLSQRPSVELTPLPTSVAHIIWLANQSSSAKRLRDTTARAETLSMLWRYAWNKLFSGDSLTFIAFWTTKIPHVKNLHLKDFIMKRDSGCVPVCCLKGI